MLWVLTFFFFSSVAQLDVELPINFEITNPKNPDLNTHVGVLEFIADEGCVNLPQWVSPLRPSSSLLPLRDLVEKRIRIDGVTLSLLSRSWINCA